MTWQVINGSSAEILKTYPDNSFDCVVTDPPYGINFLGKSWDSNTGDKEVYEQCFRVLKPGGHLLAFSAARTYHHLAMSVEMCGFEIRDQIMWIYGSGFPKSQDIGRQIDKAAGKKDPNYGSKKTDKQGNESVADFANGVRCGKCNKTFNAEIIKDCKEESCGMKYTPQTDEGKQWSGWGTQLKPAHEPIVMARKPVIGSIRENVLEHGTGAINIDACRVEYENEKDMEAAGLNWNKTGYETGGPRFVGSGAENESVIKPKEKKNNINIEGRFPANVIHDGSDEVVSMFPHSTSGARKSTHKIKGLDTGEQRAVFGDDAISGKYNVQPFTDAPAEEGSAARFFYCPKVSGKERHIGTAENNHPTVKPIELMKYLIKLVTPPNGHILDPFNGSGSTGCAAVELGFDYTGIELDPNYVEIATKRISHWESECKPKTTYNNLFEEY